MAKLVDALVSGSSAERHAGSIPVPGTDRKRKLEFVKCGRFLFLLGDAYGVFLNENFRQFYRQLPSIFYLFAIIDDNNSL